VEQRGLKQPDLEALGETLGSLVTPGTVLFLEGPMGAGKTTFTRALGRGMALHRPDRVCSPTFNICLTHDGPVPLMHIDLFRLAPDDGTGPMPASFEALGLEALLDRLTEDEPDTDTEAAVVVIEWSNLWQHEALDALTIRLRRPEPESRDLEALAGGPRHGALLRRWAGSPVAFRPKA
jgi:tRNA threonylcarbamoyl adenosine modification protein YjeE